MNYSAISQNAVLKIKNVSKAFPGVQALSDVSFSVYPGEIHALLGENGAGKSTLLKTIFGVYRPDSGTFEIDGQEVIFKSPAEAINSGVAMVHQELSLIPQLNAIQNIVLGREMMRLGTINWSEARRRAEISLKRIGFKGNPNESVSNLSVAQQQLIEIARALSFEARILILDEPTSALTSQESNQLFEIVEKLRANNYAIIYVSHRLKEVLQLADRVTVLRDGKLITSIVRSEIQGEHDLVRHMVGRNLEEIERPDLNTTHKVEVMRVENLTIPGVVEDINISLYAGEIVCLAGMVGSGRTEIARAINGTDPRSTCRIYLNKKEIEIKNPRSAINYGIALLPEDRKRQGLVLHMSAASNATLPDPPGKFGFISRKIQESITTQALLPLNATFGALKMVKELSGGTQQKVVLARWLLTNSQVFIFDEPTRGIDVGAKLEIHNLMRDLAREGKVILMISSDLPEVLSVSDRVLVIRRGRLVKELEGTEITEEQVVLHATQG
jgi:ABC-type sugar transport system ATPase subunit